MKQISRRNLKKVGRDVVFVFIIILGVGMFAFGVRGALARHHQKQYYQTVRGVIKEVYVHEGDSGDTYSAEYYYEVDGKGYTIKDSVSTSNEIHAGRTVEIHYDPDAPEQAYVEGRMSAYGLLLILGLMFTLIPLIIFVSGFTIGGAVIEVLQALLLGGLFSGLGFGLLFLVKPDGIVLPAILFFFGCIGICLPGYTIGYTIYEIFAGKPSDKTERQQ